MTSLDATSDASWIEPRTSGVDALPHPTTERWQPLRLGLVDLFYYDDEQFWFHDGRLLLRGNNGTGKSKVLALTLPFVLDGSIAPRRVEPDADPKKRMDWNLLLGGAHTSSERIGYAWVEFGRVDDDGVENFTTLGIGLKAAAGRGIVKTWYFTSARRIGDLRLVDANRIVLTQERLRDELDETGSGKVYTTQEAYRRAVDELLFRLGDRYAALIDLLIQLRQPQLSKKPDEKALSAALTEALTPLDQAVVADVAESFRSLEEERIGIADAKDTLKAAETFLGHYRAYARVATRRHTTSVRLANSTYEQAGRALREALDQLSDAAGEVDRASDEREQAKQRRSVLEGEKQALQESPEMRDATRLDDAERAAADAERRTDEAGGETVRARDVAEREASRKADADNRYDAAAAEAQRHGQKAAALARPAGLAAEHAAIATDEAEARRALSRRKDQVTHVRRLVDAAAAADTLVGQRRQALDDADGVVARRGEEVQVAESAVVSAVEEHSEEVRAYAAGLSALAPESEPGELRGLAGEWARTLDGESPAKAAVDAAVAVALDRISRERADAEQSASRLDAQSEDVRAEIDALEAGLDPEPPPAPGRDPLVRQGQAGAPLWRLTDFAEGVSASDRAGLEAALESAGILDAWIFPDGTMRTDGDVVLGAQSLEAAASVADVLRPAVGPEVDVPAEAVAGILSRIGLGESSGVPLWVTTSGRWGAGPARGAWTKPQAAYVGAGARESHRQEMLAALRTRASELEVEREGVRERVDAARRDAEQVRAERAAYPAASERAVLACHERAAGARRELDSAEQAVSEARSALEDASAAAARAREELADQAGQLDLGITADALGETMEALSAYAEALVEVRASARTLADAGSVRDQAAEREAEAAETLERRESAGHELTKQASALRAKYDALHATVGDSVAELQAKLGDVGAAIDRVDSELSQLEKDHLAAVSRHATLEEKTQNLAQRRTESASARDAEVESLRSFASTGLLRVALPDLDSPAPEAEEEWTATAALSLARGAEQQLEHTDESDDAWARAQQRASTASTDLTTHMSRHGHTAVVEQHGDVIVARVRYLSDEVDIDRLAQRLADDVADRERLLSAREREILENHLVNEVAGHLHELLLAADGQIDRMNRELADRKTSTGMQLRVRWRERTDGPAGLAATRDLMLRSDATWTADDRSAIGEFLQARIAEVRQADPTAGWQEQLEQALDYRQWHSFSVQRWQNGQWRSASGPASGGEKALAVSVPLFAAASAHYNSAGPLAPRLILLDEAFAGVDDDSRAKSLGLLATFDLDVVMTSEREWGCYPQVPGLSIAQLSRVEGVEAVGVTRWRWDGRRRQRVDEVADSARAGADSTKESDDDTLFG